MISGFQNDTAVFLVEEQVDTSNDDPYSDDPTPVLDWVPLNASWDYVDGDVVYDESEAQVPVRSEQQDGEYVSEVYGSFDQEVYRLFVDPRDVGEITDGGYELGIEANDRVALGVTDGHFSLQPPNVRRLDSEIPEFVRVEATRVSE